MRMTMLQEKALAPRVEGRFSSDHAKWQVIEQDPQAGTLVKAGRPVLLLVSRGPIVDRIGHYVGRDLEEVRLELQTAFASYRALITIREPVARVTDPAAAGTILAQNPPADTPVVGEMKLELVVSKGPGGDLIELADYVGRPALEVRDELAAAQPAVRVPDPGGAGRRPARQRRLAVAGGGPGNTLQLHSAA